MGPRMRAACRAHRCLALPAPTAPPESGTSEDCSWLGGRCVLRAGTRARRGVGALEEIVFLKTTLENCALKLQAAPSSAPGGLGCWAPSAHIYRAGSMSDSSRKVPRKRRPGRRSGGRSWRWLRGLGSLARSDRPASLPSGLPSLQSAAAEGAMLPSGPRIFLPCLLSLIHKPGGYRRSLNIDVSPPTAPPLTQLQNSSRTVLNYLFPYSISISLIKSYNV